MLDNILVQDCKFYLVNRKTPPKISKSVLKIDIFTLITNIYDIIYLLNLI